MEIKKKKKTNQNPWPAREMGTNQNQWPAREMKTNQNPSPNPSTEGNQLDVSQPRNSLFQISRVRIPYISTVTQSLRLLSLVTVSVTVRDTARAW